MGTSMEVKPTLRLRRALNSFFGGGQGYFIDLAVLELIMYTRLA